MSDTPHPVRAFSDGLALAVLYILLLIVCFWFVISSMLAQWADDPNYTHGFFVLPMALVLVWRRRRSLAAVPASTSRTGVAVMLFAGFVYLAGVVAAELFTMRFSLVMMTAGMVLALQGRERMRILLFPCLFLLFMIPLPYIFYYKLTFPMQLQSSRLTAAVLSALGMPVVRNGNVINLENYSLEVVTACSGLRSMMTLGTLAVFMADFLRKSWPWKLLLVALVFPIAILANTARLVSTAAISALSGEEAAESYLHELSGVVVFMTGFVILAVCGLLLERVGNGVLLRRRIPLLKTHDNLSTPSVETPFCYADLGRRSNVMKIATVVIMVLFAVAGNYLRTSGPPAEVGLGLENARLDPGVTGASGDYREEEMDDHFLETLSAREVVFRTYTAGSGDPVWLFMGYFDRQQEGSQVHSPKHCYPGSGWNIVDERAVPAPWGDGEVRSLVVTDGIQRRLVFYWFQTTTGHLNGVLPLKLYLTKNAVMRKSQDVVFIRVSTVIDGSRRAAADRLGPFAVAARSEIESLYRVRYETD